METTYNLDGAASVARIVEQDCHAQKLTAARKNALWLMDTLFPTGFVYTVNQGPSMAITELPQ